MNTFNVVTKSIDIEMNNDINAEFIYKMVFVSERISWKRNNHNKSKPIELLSSHYSKNKEFFNNKKIIMIIFNHLIKRKSDKKKSNDGPKSSLSTFTKNIFSRKRDR